MEYTQEGEKKENTTGSGLKIESDTPDETTIGEDGDVVSLSSRRLEAVPSSVFSWTYLTQLYLARNRLKKLPPELAR